MLIRGSVVAALLVGCLLFQYLTSYSLLEVYFFRTRLVPNPRSDDPGIKQIPLTEPDAERIVIFLVDGLRADALFALSKHSTTKDATGQPEAVAPYIRNLIQTSNARWGIAKASLPTESVPGHMRLLAGVESDPYAVLNDEQNYTIAPQSLFTTSSASFSFWCHRPTSAVNNAYQQLAKRMPRVFSNIVHRHSDEEVVNTCDDTVFLSAKHFFKKANDEAKEAFSKSGAFFLLDLQSIDSVPHANSPLYLSAVTRVDNLTRSFVEFFDKQFEDKKTTYLLVSDHGRHYEGWHGMDRPEITYTPFVIWGAGVSPQEVFRPLTETPNPAYYWLRDNYFVEDKAAVRTWGAHLYEPHIINQVDLVPLMSTVMGREIPLQSVGKVTNCMPFMAPSPVGYAQSIYANAQQMWNQYDALIQENLWMVSLYYLGLLGSPPTTEEINSIECAVGDARHLDGRACPTLTHAAIRQARVVAAELLNRASDGIEKIYYYSSYPALLVVMFSHVWLGYFLMGYAIFPEHKPFISLHSKDEENSWHNHGITLIASTLLMWAWLFIFNAAFHLYIHWAIIIALTPSILKKWKNWNNWWYISWTVISSYLPEHWQKKENYSVTFTHLAMRTEQPLTAHHFGLLLLGINFVNAGYRSHFYWPIVFVAVSFWGLRHDYTTTALRRTKSMHSSIMSFLFRNIKNCWIFACGAMALFTLAPTQYHPDYNAIWLSGLAILGVIVLGDTYAGYNWQTLSITGVKVIYICVILWIDHDTMNFRTNSTYQIMTWTLLVLSAVMAALFSGKRKAWPNTAKNIAFFILCTSLLLSISSESSFLLTHIATQIIWVGMEYSLYHSPHTIAEKGQSQIICRIMFAFWVFTHTAILGTRSVHSICFNHSGYPVREGNPYPAFYRFWGGSGEWQLSSEHHLMLLYWLQLVTPLIFVAFSTASVVNIWKESITPFSRLPLLLASLAIGSGMQAFLGVTVYDTAWLETGQQVLTWVLQSSTYVLFLALYGLGTLLAPSSFDHTAGSSFSSSSSGVSGVGGLGLAGAASSSAATAMGGIPKSHGSDERVLEV